jgi:hypothetical protein
MFKSRQLGARPPWVRHPGSDPLSTYSHSAPGARLGPDAVWPTDHNAP